MNNDIVKEKHRNNKEEVDKKRRKDIETLQEEIQQINEKIEIEQALLEQDNDRNAMPSQLYKKEKEITMNLQQDRNQLVTNINMAQSKINDLETRRDNLYNTINIILKEKRKIDKYNMELEEKINERNVSDEVKKAKRKNEERKMRIKHEKNLDNLKLNGIILMEKTTDEETKSKDVLDTKLKLE